MASSIQESAKGASAASRAWRRLTRNTLAWVSGVVLLMLMLVGLVGPSIIAGDGPNVLSEASLMPPGMEHLLGTDELGRDVLVLLIYGVRTSLTVGVIAAVSATVVGIVIGAVSGFMGGRIDAVLMRAAEIFQVMPSFVLAAVIVAMSGPGLLRVICVIAMLSWPQVARVMRGEVLQVKEFGFVDAARCLGVSEQSILWFEIVPNAIAPVIALCTLIVGQAILLESALSFFGLTQPDVPTWGLLLNSGQRFFYQAWWLSVFPGIFILATVLAFNFFGEAVGNSFSPKAQELIR
jgi:peptide/nickel transport system permease protein